MIVGAFHTAGQSNWVTKDPYPFADLPDKTDATDVGTLLGQAEEAIKGNDQARACAVVHRYGEVKLPPRPVFDLLVKYAVSEDAALHAEVLPHSDRRICRYPTGFPLAASGGTRGGVTASEHGFPARLSGSLRVVGNILTPPHFEAHGTAHDRVKPKRRWFRFGLRTLFVLVARVGVAAGWVACQLNWIQQRHEFFKRDGVSYSYPGAGAKTLAPWSLRLYAICAAAA